MNFTDAQLRAAERRGDALLDPHRQLAQALAQAEGYRNFLASLTGLLTAVFVLKGQEDLSQLGGRARLLVIALLAGGFVLLIAASWLSVLAVHGRPGVQVCSEPMRLLTYEVRRTRVVWRLVEWCRWLALVAICAVAAAVLVTWLAPS
ncbi:hypothetical protein [Streptomyces physcomitrii]|uniref:Uncharacterized protein n=1 Tax=Streptomyces physcomitrii TaxID=2724184 RepID=A0ABX1H272_9ACTN|nr:hypothetical protein [Streptomyces physcomitrii]NKI41344.1 hypothetical protein [Streptomyces physcomitrii]